MTPKSPATGWRRRVRDGRTLLIENAVAQLLRHAHLLRRLRQPHLERADAAEALRRPVRARSPGLQAAIGLQRRKQPGNTGAGRLRAEAFEQTAGRNKDIAGARH